jgi:ABC-type Fe3+-hydroxamate transport system substrate-binding protein
MQLNLPQDISKQISYDKIINADPEYLIIAPCGFSLEITIEETKKFIVDNQ